MAVLNQLYRLFCSVELLFLGHGLGRLDLKLCGCAELVVLLHKVLSSQALGLGLRVKRLYWLEQAIEEQISLGIGQRRYRLD